MPTRDTTHRIHPAAAVLIRKANELGAHMLTDEATAYADALAAEGLLADAEHDRAVEVAALRGAADDAATQFAEFALRERADQVERGDVPHADPVEVGRHRRGRSSGDA